MTLPLVPPPSKVRSCSRLGGCWVDALVPSLTTTGPETGNSALSVKTLGTYINEATADFAWLSHHLCDKCKFVYVSTLILGRSILISAKDNRTDAFASTYAFTVKDNPGLYLLRQRAQSATQWCHWLTDVRVTTLLFKGQKKGRLIA